MIIRKEREWAGFILCWFASMFVGLALNEVDGIISWIVLCVLAFVTFEAIKAISTYDIKSWTHTKHVEFYLFIGCFGGIFIGGIVYFYLRYKELKTINHDNRTT